MKGLFVAQFDQFIKPIISELQDRGFECEFVNNFDKTKHSLNDYIWVDFFGEEAVLVQEYLTSARKILRIHSYEIYQDFIYQLQPKEWDAIIFVSEAMKEAFMGIFGKELNNLHVISNYIDLDEMVIPKDKKANNKVAYAGYFNNKKNIVEIYQIAMLNKDYEFYLAGKPQENDLWEYMLANKPENVTIMEWQTDMAGFFADKTYYINSSVRESMCVSMVEAMCCGLKPIVKNWISADRIYPKDCIYSQTGEVSKLLKTTKPFVDYRDYIIKHLHLDSVIDDIISVIMDNSEEEVIPTITVGIVQTRKKYIHTLLNSLSISNYPLTIDVYDNFGREESIGKCFNALADRCKTDWILYVGDDDVISEDYIANAMMAYHRRKNMYPNIIALLTGSILFDESGKKQLSSAFPTGFWKTDVVRDIRFDETLVRQVDTEFAQRVAQTEDKTILKLDWIVGYYYRQHESNVSGNKFTEGANISQDPVEEQ